MPGSFGHAAPSRSSDRHSEPTTTGRGTCSRVPASVVRRFDRAVVLAVRWAVHGTLPSGCDVTLGLREDAVGPVGISAEVAASIWQPVALEPRRSVPPRRMSRPCVCNRLRLRAFGAVTMGAMPVGTIDSSGTALILTDVLQGIGAKRLDGARGLGTRTAGGSRLRRHRDSATGAHGSDRAGGR